MVYRAQDVDSGRIVALKTVSVINEEQLANIRREIRSLARLRHPGVVQILAEGLDAGKPWYAMDLLDGSTLHTYCASRPVTRKIERSRTVNPDPEPPARSDAHPSVGATIRLDRTPENSDTDPPISCPDTGRPRRIDQPHLQRALSIVRRLCRTLSYLHGEGIVHRDLKPDNILIQDGELPVIVDFGVAARFAGALSREAIDVGGIVVGTLVYMAPEQIRGEFVDARADLYSLGCILYEMITGCLPFQQISTMQIVQAQLYETVVPPAHLVEGCPNELDGLVMRLLEKDPRKRFGYADDVAKVLGNLGGDDAFPTDCPDVQAYLYRSGFVGRDEWVERIRERLDRLTAGTGGLVLVGGETGVGKTRFAMEMTRRVDDRDINVLASDCGSVTPVEGRSGRMVTQPLSPFIPLLHAIASECRTGGMDTTERLLGRRGKVLAHYEPLLAQLPGQDGYPDPEELPQDAARDRAMAYLADTIDLFTERQPLLMVIDDLQWADAMTIGFLRFLADHRMPHLRLMILGTYRTEEIGEQLDSFAGNEHVLSVRLERLSEQDVERMVGDMLAIDSPPRSLVSFLTGHSEGNPFFVAEYMRMLVSRRLLVRDEDGLWRVMTRATEEDEGEYATMVLPRSLRELVMQRLAGIRNAVARQAIDAASVLGREFHPGLLARVCSLTDTELHQVMDELIGLQLIEPWGVNLRFVHDKQREVALDAIPADTRIHLHRRAALVIDTFFRERRQEFLTQLAYHWEAAGDPERARECYLAAAVRAMAGYSIVQAGKLFGKYFGLVDHPTLESIRMRVEYASRVLIAQGRMLDAVQELEVALREARTAGEDRYQAISLQALADVLRAIGRYGDARRFCARALALHRSARNRKAEGIATSNLAMIAFGEGQLAEARRLMQGAIAIHRQTGDLREEAISAGRLGSILISEGRFEEALPLIESAIAIHRQNRNRRDEAAALANLNSIFWAQNRLDDAAVTLEHALGIFEEIGDLRGAGMVLTNLATVYLMQQRFEEAQSMHERAIAFHRRFGERAWEGADLMNHAGILHRTGKLAEAVSRYEEAIRMLNESEDRYTEGQAIGQLGTVFEEMLKWDKARQLYQTSIRMLREIGDNLYVPFTLYRLARLERLAGNTAADRQAMIREAEASFRLIGNDYMVGMCIVERGYLALERGESALDAIYQAKQISKSVLTRNPQKLKEAVDELLNASATSNVKFWGHLT